MYAHGTPSTTFSLVFDHAQELTVRAQKRRAQEGAAEQFESISILGDVAGFVLVLCASVPCLSEQA